jgi:hypothetical protein
MGFRPREQWLTFDAADQLQYDRGRVEHRVQGGDGVGRGDRKVRGGAAEQGRGLRAEHNARWSTERQDRHPRFVRGGRDLVDVLVLHHGNPPAGPLELGRVGDGHQPGPVPGQPRPPGAEGVAEVGVGQGQLGHGHLSH